MTIDYHEHTGIFSSVSEYYTEKLRTFGAQPRGVDWKDADSQETRFVHLCRIFGDYPGASVIDFGCGYGELVHYLRRQGFCGDYLGIDVSRSMVEAAQKHCAGVPNVRLLHADAPDIDADFGIASGIFNVRLEFDDKAWLAYLLSVLENMNRHTRHGFSFNCLTRYSDADQMRNNLFYADPLFVFDYCKRYFSNNVALLHDYGMYEFTILVRKQQKALLR